MNQTKHRTFKDILEGVARQNALRLMYKARLANRVAKAAIERQTRVGAYGVKTEALFALNKRFPQQITVEPDSRYGCYFVLVLNRSARFGLHARAEDFERRIA